MRLIIPIACIIMLLRKTEMFINAIDFSQFNCQDCVKNNGQQCLLQSDFTQSSCCDTTNPFTQQSQICLSQSQNQFCATSQKITNRILLDFVCPADPTYCPNSQNQNIVLSSWNNIVYQQQSWSLNLPDPSFQWHCKYLIQANQQFIQGIQAYIMVQIEQYGFDNDVFLIVQMQGQYNDFSNGQTNVNTYVYSVFFGTTFYIPAQYEALLLFQPTSSYDGSISQSGSIILRASLLQNIQSSPSSNFNMIMVPSPQSIQNTNLTNQNQSTNQTQLNQSSNQITNQQNQTSNSSIQQQNSTQNQSSLQQNQANILQNQSNTQNQANLTNNLSLQINQSNNLFNSTGSQNQSQNQSLQNQTNAQQQEAQNQTQNQQTGNQSQNLTQTSNSSQINNESQSSNTLSNYINFINSVLNNQTNSSQSNFSTSQNQSLQSNLTVNSSQSNSSSNASQQVNNQSSTQQDNNSNSISQNISNSQMSQYINGTLSINKQKFFIQTTPQNITKIAWNGNVIPKGPWQNQTLFRIGNLNVTKQDVVLGAGAIAGIIIGGVVVCCVISYWQRQKLRQVAHRASTIVVNKLRQSFSSNTKNEQNTQKIDEIAQTVAVTNDKQQQEFLKDLFDNQKLQDTNQKIMGQYEQSGEKYNQHQIENKKEISKTIIEQNENEDFFSENQPLSFKNDQFEFDNQTEQNQNENQQQNNIYQNAAQSQFSNNKMIQFTVFDAKRKSTSVFQQNKFKKFQNDNFDKKRNTVQLQQPVQQKEEEILSYRAFQKDYNQFFNGVDEENVEQTSRYNIIQSSNSKNGLRKIRDILNLLDEEQMILEYPISENEDEDLDSSNSIQDGPNNLKEEQSFDAAKFKQLMENTKHLLFEIKQIDDRNKEMLVKQKLDELEIKKEQSRSQNGSQKKYIQHENIDLIDAQEDEQIIEFYKRKDTIMRNIKELAHIKYSYKQDKQKKILKSVQSAFEEQEQVFLETRKSIKKNQKFGIQINP